MHHHTGSAKAASGNSSTSAGGSKLNPQGWENSDFPILCETCLGPNPYMRMTKKDFDKECKICARPFTVFRWRPGKDARHKKTEICQTCAKLKNVCQTCLFDLEYGLPVQVRDQELNAAMRIDIPKSDAHKEWFAEQAEGKIALNDLPYGKAAPTDTLLKLARTTPYYQRNRAHICSFFVKGECKRGTECPYRHEMPTTGELSQQNIKDRYYGVNDPVANKMLRTVGEKREITPPEDKSITTLYLGGVTEAITEEDLRAAMYSYGEIVSIKLITRSKCAFVTFTERESAEKAVKKIGGALILKGTKINVMWGRPQGNEASRPQSSSDPSNPYTNPPPSVVGQPAMGPMHAQPQPQNMPPFPPPPGMHYPGAPGPYPMPQGYPAYPMPHMQGPPGPPPMMPSYPSMNPHAMGSRPHKKAS